MDIQPALDLTLAVMCLYLSVVLFSPRRKVRWGALCDAVPRWLQYVEVLPETGLTVLPHGRSSIKVYLTRKHQAALTRRPWTDSLACLLMGLQRTLYMSINAANKTPTEHV